MNSFDGIDYDAINEAVRLCHNGPHAEVLELDAPVPIHLLHFDREGQWDRSPLIYAHRNGNGSTLAKLKAGGWRLCRFWKDPEEVNKYPTRFERASVADLLLMITPSTDETLQFLPKKATPGAFKRLISYREHLLELTSDRGAGDAFSLAWTGEVAGPKVNSPKFQGKPWESRDAVEWCQRMIPSKRDDVQIQRANLSAATAVFGELEDHPMAYMF